MQAAPVSARVVGFLDHLRLNEFTIGLSESEVALSLLAGAQMSNAETTRRRLKVLLTGRRDEWNRFDDLFEAYWHARGRERPATDTKRDTKHSWVSGGSLWRRHAGSDEAPANDANADGGDIEIEDGADGRLIASERTTRMRTDLREFADPREIAEAERMALQLARAMRYRISRRHRPARRGARLDMRRIIRASLARGGEPITLLHRRPPERPVRIVIFLDVSGSMKPYSRFFLQFVKGLVCTWVEADAYLLHTKLVRVTDAVRERDSVKAMSRLALMAEGFGGGTKLGGSLAQFNDQYAKQALNSRSVAVVVSDGYDTGTPEQLAHELSRLKRRARRLVWLNPLLGWKQYEPVTAAMTAAIPLIDHFAAANTLQSLAELEPHLARL